MTGNAEILRLLLQHRLDDDEDDDFDDDEDDAEENDTRYLSYQKFYKYL
jgi:hypothetical protein